MRKWVSIGLILGLAVAGARLRAQSSAPRDSVPPSSSQAAPTFRSTTSVVALNVTVTDGKKLVTGLRERDFAVFEDGVQQQVRFFESTRVPLDVILLLDMSSSMRDKMSSVHDAARGFMKILRKGDRGAVIGFTEHVKVLQELTEDTSAIEAAIGSTTANGSTGLHNAVYIALKEFGRPAVSTGEIRRQAIAVLSDGADTASVVTFDDVLTLARSTGVNVYTIALQSKFESGRTGPDIGKFSEATYAMRTLAKETGAQSFFPASVHDLKAVYTSIAQELEAQYSIAYEPSEANVGGRFRRIVVRVTSNPAFRPRTRSGYSTDGRRSGFDAPPFR